jgi:hypothetical protein
MPRLHALLLLAVNEIVNASSGTLEGSVTSNLGPPVTSGTIAITVNGVPAAPAQIDAAGHYQTVVTWPGASASCNLHASAKGFLDAEIDSVVLSSGGAATTDFTLIEDIFNGGFEGPP